MFLSNGRAGSGFVAFFLLLADGFDGPFDLLDVEWLDFAFVDRDGELWPALAGEDVVRAGCSFVLPAIVFQQLPDEGVSDFRGHVELLSSMNTPTTAYANWRKVPSVRD
jgi:hypothetical protein